MEDKITLKGELQKFNQEYRSRYRMYLTDEEWFNCIKNILRKKKIKDLFKL
jgi:hypothetical protein